MDSKFNIPAFGEARPKGRQDSKTSVPPLFGLVLAGGKSARMGVDKVTLRYHDKTQSEHCFELLGLFCERVFLSNRKEQEESLGHRGLPQINDVYAGSGPLVGILSAMQAHPHAAWLVLACDMPFLDPQVIGKLAAHRNTSKAATAFVSSEGGPEPLCAIYEPSMALVLLGCIQDDYYSPRFALLKSDIQLVKPDRPSSLMNINFLSEKNALARVLPGESE